MQNIKLGTNSVRIPLWIFMRKENMLHLILLQTACVQPARCRNSLEGPHMRPASYDRGEGWQHHQGVNYNHLK